MENRTKNLWHWFFKDKKTGSSIPECQNQPKAKIPSKFPDVTKSLKLPKNFNINLPKNVNIGNLLMEFFQKTMKEFGSPGSVKPPHQGEPRHMKFPYTFSAKIAQFPYKFYYKNCWVFQYYPWGFALSLPVFWYISRLSNSEANKAKWKEIRQKEKEEARQKFYYS